MLVDLSCSYLSPALPSVAGLGWVEGPSDMNISDVTPHLAGEDGGSVPAVTFFAAMAGLAMSGVFPAGLSWSGAELIQVTGRISSCVFVSASLGAMLNPLVVSRLMQVK